VEGNPLGEWEFYTQSLYACSARAGYNNNIMSSSETSKMGDKANDKNGAGCDCMLFEIDYKAFLSLLAEYQLDNVLVEFLKRHDVDSIENSSLGSMHGCSDNKVTTSSNQLVSRSLDNDLNGQHLTKIANRRSQYRKQSNFNFKPRSSVIGSEASIKQSPNKITKDWELNIKSYHRSSMRASVSTMPNSRLSSPPLTPSTILKHGPNSSSTAAARGDVSHVPSDTGIVRNSTFYITHKLQANLKNNKMMKLMSTIDGDANNGKSTYSYVIMPDSRIKILWVFVIFVILIYYGFSVPYSLAFSSNYDSLEHNNSSSNGIIFVDMGLFIVGIWELYANIRYLS
jgi:hypothetical protein